MAAQTYKFSMGDTRKILGSAEFRAAVANRERQKTISKSVPSDSWFPDGRIIFRPVGWGVALDKDRKTQKVVGNLWSVRFAMEEPIEDKGKSFTMYYRVRAVTPKDKTRDPFSGDAANMRRLIRAAEINDVDEAAEADEARWSDYLEAICGANMLVKANASIQERTYKDAKGQMQTANDRQLKNLSQIAAGEATNGDGATHEEAATAEETAPADDEVTEAAADEEVVEDEAAEAPAFEVGDKVTTTVAGKTVKGKVTSIDADNGKVVVQVGPKKYAKAYDAVEAV